MGAREYYVRLNSNTGFAGGVESVADQAGEWRNGLPERRRAGALWGGNSKPTSSAEDGARGLYLTILKNGKVSTLNIVNQVKAMVPKLEAMMLPDVHLTLMGDQSVHVRATIAGVLREGIIAALLTALMILLFLGSWRSTLIVSRFDPAQRPRFDHLLMGGRANAECDDARRPRAGGWHSRG